MLHDCVSEMRKPRSSADQHVRSDVLFIAFYGGPRATLVPPGHRFLGINGRLSDWSIPIPML